MPAAWTCAAKHVAHAQDLVAGHRHHRREADVAARVAARPARDVAPRHVRDPGHDLLAPAPRSRRTRRGAKMLTLRSAPGIRSNAARTLARRWATTASSPYQREAHPPAADLELARDPLDPVLGDRPLAVEPVRAARVERRRVERVEDRRDHPQRAVEQQPPQRVHQRRDVVVAPDPQPHRREGLGLRHQPDARAS